MFDTETHPETLAAPVLASDSIGQLAAALAKAQGEMSHAVKDSTNPHFRSTYADLASVISACRPALAKHGIAVIQRTMSADGGVVVHTTLMHESGEWVADSGLHVPASKQDAQGYGSAITYGRRYALSAMTGIAQDDDDGNAAAASVPAQRTTRSTATTRRRNTAKPSAAPAAAPVVETVSSAARESLLARITALPDEVQAGLKQRMKDDGVSWQQLTPANAGKVSAWVDEASGTDDADDLQAAMQAQGATA